MHDASRLVPPTGAVTRELILNGDAAVQWIGSLGWAVAPLSSRFQLVADLIRTDTFAIGRIWHTPAAFSYTADGDASNCMFHAVVGIEGTQTVTSETDQVELGPGQMHVQSFSEALGITAQEPAARLLFVSQWSDLQDSEGRAPLPRSGLFGSSNAHKEIFSSAAHAALNSLTTVDGAGFHRVRAGLDHLFAGVLADDAPVRAKRSRGAGSTDMGRAGRGLPPSLLRRASQQIEARASDVTFDAGRLARDLGVSTASLYRAYEDSNLTPASQLRRVRTRLARDLLEAPGEFGDVDTQNLKRIAAAAGFGSVRAMRRALDGLSDSESEARPDISEEEPGIARTER
ncbi:hypothetical protein C5B85_01810 [Pseudoclavibacter sp. AY1F1]|uniref:helix-turn-helix domain-containing protein n=1 Tax=Pseudoclavibacter sp. AY1F1 TaxID=2080583 RepID=UPI000CE7CDEF|nr:helix-turn-helix domain-containing protein [Pseudoclavibacter sp. AY1F1]PPF47035.1 hypothetical protein C5B85_01810 [Pseudoclavibacter sp. AY1F1]